MITNDILENLSDTEIESMPLSDKVKIIHRISWGIGDRMAEKFKVSNSFISMVISGKRNNQLLHEYIDKVSTILIQRYINNKDLSRDELLTIEKSIRV